jgi:tetratricopeptide (TPR) repeat protein
MPRTRRAKIFNTLPYSLVLLGGVLVALSLFSFVLKDGSAMETGTTASSNMRGATDRLIERLQIRLDAIPEDSQGYVRLGSAYLQKARETGDISYYTRAEAALQEVLALDSGNAAAMTAMGVLELGLHRFPKALDWARRSLKANPHNPDPYGVLGDAQLELGQYDDAVESYQAMVDLKPDLASYARVARMRELMGDTDGAIRAMRLAVESGQPGAESTAWAWTQLGNLYFNSGDIDEAASHYEAALKFFDDYHIALAALGRTRAAQGHYDQAIALYQRAISIVPLPPTLAALGDLYTITGDTSKAQLQYDTVEVIAELSAINGQIYNRELALFYGDHDLKLGDALDFATRELEVRKDIYGYDALAWALHKNGRHFEAAEAIAEAMRLGTQDASLFYHAGMIYYGLGEHEKSRHYLEQALALNPHFSLLQAHHARRTLEAIEGAAS